MQITLHKAELKQFIDTQVNAGLFESPEAVIEAALARLMLEDQPQTLNEEVWKAIEEANSQFERGEVVDFVDFAAEMRRKYCAE